MLQHGATGTLPIRPGAATQPQASAGWLVLQVWQNVLPHLSLRDSVILLLVSRFFHKNFKSNVAEYGLQQNCIQEVLLSETHSFFIYPNGRVRVCGTNRNNQLGLDKAKDQPWIDVPTLVTYRVKQTLSDNNEPIFITSDGRLGVYDCEVLEEAIRGTQLTYLMEQIQLDPNAPISKLPDKLPGFDCKGLQKLLSASQQKQPDLFPIRRIYTLDPDTGGLILSENGNVWGWGVSMIGVLGQRTQEGREVLRLIPELSNIQQIAAHYHHHVYVNNVGEVWENGLYTDEHSVPTKILNLPPIPIKQALNIMTVTLCLDMQGQVWVCRSGDHRIDKEWGNIADRSVPVCLPNPTNVSQMLPFRLGGAQWVYLLGTEGKVWMLGRGRQITPQLMDLPPIQQIVIYRDVTYFLDNTGKVWECSIGNPTVILNLPPIKKIVARSSTVAFFDVADQVWMYGDNKDGQLGLGHTKPVKTSPITTPVLLATASQKTIIPRLSTVVLVELACKSSNYGKLCYEAIIERLKQEKDLNRIIPCILKLESSPWKQHQLQAEVLAPLLKLDLSPGSLVASDDEDDKKILASAGHIFEALLNLYNYVMGDVKLSGCQNDFVDLLTKFIHGGTDQVDKLKEYCAKTNAVSQAEASKALGVFAAPELRLTAQYCELMQKFLSSVVQQPGVFKFLPAAALHLQYRKFMVENKVSLPNEKTSLPNESEGEGLASTILEALGALKFWK